jgi:hypothetical protein
MMTIMVIHLHVDGWYLLAESLFLISCMVQACAAIVETAQSLDGFIASFILDETYAIELLPLSFRIITWSPSECEAELLTHRIGSTTSVSLTGCETPFEDSGLLILSLGFVVTSAMFIPLAVGNLKETMFVQLMSFVFLLLLLCQFYGVFLTSGFSNAWDLPLFG